MLETRFLFESLGWVDDETDLPLLFSFYYLIAEGDVEFQIIADTVAPRHADVLLPQGGGNGSVITGIVYIADQVRRETWPLSRFHHPCCSISPLVSLFPSRVSIAGCINTRARIRHERHVGRIRE